MGSKRKLMNDYIQLKCTNIPFVIVNAYHPGSTFKLFLNRLMQITFLFYNKLLERKKKKAANISFRGYSQ